MFRLYFSVFWRKPDGRPNQRGANGPAGWPTHGEAPVSMKVPLVLLALGSVFAGFIPFSKLVTADGTPGESQGIGAFAIAPVAIALTGVLIAGYLYRKESDRPARAAAFFGGLYRFAYHKFYIDEVYSFITKKIIFNLIGRPAAWIDRNIVDGLMNLLATVTAMISAGIKGLQSGKVQDYAVYFFAGIAGLAVLFIYIYT